MLRVSQSLLLFSLSSVSLSQVGSLLPPERVVDWSRAGVENGIPRAVDLEIDVAGLKRTNPAQSDNEIFTRAIEEARAFRQSCPSCWISLYFPSGTYSFSAPLTLDPALDSNLIVRGDGSDKTFFNFDIPSGNLIQVVGPGHQSAPVSLDPIAGFAKGTNVVRILTALEHLRGGDYIELVQSNGPWIGNYDGGTGTPPADVVGQIIQVKAVRADGTTLELNDALRINYRQDLNPRIRKVGMMKNVGFENLGVRNLSMSDQDGGPSIFVFGYAANCWLWGVESSNANSAHVGISASSHIEVRGCYFHDATSYGGGGHGYGVSIGGRSTNCLIEDNVFSRLRHAMIVARGANGNVYAYNYSRDQLDDNPTFPVHYREGDVSIHGHYPFANLFEGNFVTYVVADNWWGDNGPYNTFFRNVIDPGDMVLEVAEYTNALGNDFGVDEPGQGVDYEADRFTFDSNRDNGSAAETILDLFGFIETGGGQVRPLSHSEATQTGASYRTIVLNGISQFRPSKPSFLDGYTWPPLGPSTGDTATGARSSTTGSIPSRDRWESALRSDPAPPLHLVVRVLLRSGLTADGHPVEAGYSINGEAVGATFEGRVRRTDVIEALPADGYAFTRWSDGSTDNPRSFGKPFSGYAEYVRTVTGVHDARPGPASSGLDANYPNPFNPSTTIPYRVSKDSHIHIAVFDLLGRLVEVLVDAWHVAGSYTAVFGGPGIQSGTYVVKMEVRAKADGSKEEFVSRVVAVD